MTNLSETTLPTIPDRFCTYYRTLKDLYCQHRENGFGKSPDIPSGFSEALCRELLGLEPGTDRSHDAVDSEGRKYEIKATGSVTGQTSMSRANEFYELIWLIIDFENDALYITRMSRELFTLDGGEGRKPVTLSPIAIDHQLACTSYSFIQQNELALAG